VDGSFPPFGAIANDLAEIGRVRRALTLVAPVLCTFAFFGCAARGWFALAVAMIGAQTFLSYGSTSHDLVHRTLGLPTRTNAILLSLIEASSLRSGTAYAHAHLQHHARFPTAEDVEAVPAIQSIRRALLEGPRAQVRIFLWAWKTHPKDRPALALEAIAVSAIVSVSIGFAPWTLVPLLYCVLCAVGSWFFPLMTVRLPHAPDGSTRAFRGALMHVLFAGHLYHFEHHLYPRIPHHHWPALARRLDPILAARGIVPVRTLRELWR
jgi:beta-carotene hydroxylase